LDKILFQFSELILFPIKSFHCVFIGFLLFLENDFIDLDKLAPWRVAKIRSPEQITNPRVEKIRKRRDRLYKKYKKTRLTLYLKKAKCEEKHLKRTISLETTRTFQKKATAPGNKSFWNSVSELQGRRSFDQLSLEINGRVENDEEMLARHTGEFFMNKIKKLASNLSAINPVMPIDTEALTFSMEEVTSAIKAVKTKMSAGPDGVPLKLVKYYGNAKPEVYLNIFNEAANGKFPDEWRVARVVAIHKKGSKRDVANYRPVSNLCSISKVYERCVLNRLNGMIDHLLGPSQHGFRPGHSTTTCLMEIKDTVLDILDGGNTAVMYSLDLSAAFDMLRRDTFVEKMRGHIPDNLLNIISDFLAGRKFFVNVGSANSGMYELDRGCPQGSVLGPILFNLYVGRVYLSLPPSVSFVAYADDSYVICPGVSVDEASSLAEETMILHVNSLKSLGMVVNEDKTEVIVMSKQKDPAILTLQCAGRQIESKPSLKALGAVIDHRLRWTAHINLLASRLGGLICGLKMVRRRFTEEQTKTLVTSQLLSILYYACPAWLTPHLQTKEFKKLESLHYRCLRLIVNDRRQRIPREWLTAATQRLPPRQWGKFAASSLAIKIRQNKAPVNIYSTIFTNTYSITRKQGRLFGFDSSKTMQGRAITRNWIGTTLGAIKSPWTGDILSNDQIRRLLKKTF